MRAPERSLEVPLATALVLGAHHDSGALTRIGVGSDARRQDCGRRRETVPATATRGG